MAINSNKYVEINSAVAAGTVVPERQLIGRLFTVNPLLPTGSVMEFSSAAAVGDYFTTESEEYKRASQYFSYQSKSLRRPINISFARWVDADAAPRIYGDKNGVKVSDINIITDGSLRLKLGGSAQSFTAIDFSSDITFSDIADTLQTKIRTGSGAMFTSATVTYDAVRGCFNLVGGEATTAEVEVLLGTSGTTTLPETLGWLTGSSLIWSDGALKEDVTDVLDNSTNLSDNFGSFLFQPELTSDEIIEAAEWNALQNIMFQYYVPVVYDDAETLSAALIGIEGVGLILTDETVDKYPEQMPMQVLASTDYNAINSVQNYMYQQFPTMPVTVISTSVSDFLDALRVNYNGATQTAGQTLAFFQRGLLMGGATSPIDMNTYANEQWLKSAAKAALFTMLLGLAKVSANEAGRTTVLSILQGVINRALSNGTISVGKTLTDAQKIEITVLTGDNQSWHQVQDIGYWVNVVIVPVTVSGRTEYKAVYTLIYSKDDVLRKVEGEHILI